MGYLIVFDMDGTLIDSEQTIIRCFKESAGKLGHKIDDASRYIGILKLTQILERNGVPEEEIPEIMRMYVDCYLRTFEEDTRTIGNSPEVLRKLQEKNELGILTLKNLNLTLEILKRFFPGINFRYIVCGDRPIENKIEGLRIIMKESGRDGKQVFYVGDRPSDVKSSELAGVNPIWVSFGLGRIDDFDFRGEFITAHSFDDILRIFS